MIPNLIGSQWIHPARETLPIYNPATGEVIEHVPLSGAEEVAQAIEAAQEAYQTWSQTSVMERTRLMFRYKELLEQHTEELSRIITLHHGKTLDEARGEVRRGIEVVDFACGAPTLLQGRTLRQVTQGIDQDFYLYPLGVVTGITPFNFPVMIPLWMFPLAVIAGNTFVLKPSERTPLGAIRLAELFLEAGFPPGVLNLVHGAKEAVDALIAHPDVRAVSFVGSAPVARYVYRQAAHQGKRVQAAGGAKNHLIVLPDADLEHATAAILNSAFGNAGERCLAGSVTIAVGSVQEPLLEALRVAAEQLAVGPGIEPGIQIGPLIRAEHRERVLRYVEAGIKEGAQLVLDGRRFLNLPGFFLGPTILDHVTPKMTVGREEGFGPVLSVSRAATLGEALAQANEVAYGNMAVIFTRSGAAARLFRERVEAGMVGINVGVAQPFGFYPFPGWRQSFYGDLHLQGSDGIEFYTRKKVVVTRW
ncbi:CoA-acylating methylmalonate-semialdehyde dehydrogenase [Thermogemmatispora tikiterensis]|uniref:methylmalonate-semialdehyde dehydrogenase (CoA acylating) n=1 Tax=Thermogemmatispora tikiterensis TaxID=1825093 RepID=A0A328VJS0_9CHLR|nr:CoA-acylating methylmalonate-semialdehyde dehydrogenase [Thermogemmatispora tikiterensis]RAQ95863.1 methylmalonate-semialdehyde dehydrogenase (acylating) [Thermogemmatispora tikiterensis]